MTTSLFNYQHFYLIGIKGVAMTALAQCLLDAGKSVRGSDVAEEFVTQPILNQRHIPIDLSFTTDLPSDTDCVIYTSAHQSQNNPQVQAAIARKLAVYTHAAALGEFFNSKDGLAVCGVGGKSTTSAMITWILEKLEHRPSYAIGVGNIPGIGKTGQWGTESRFFVAEADEYVTDPSAPSRGVEITPRFSFLNPLVTVCTNLKHDHPDVYPDFAATKRYFQRFFDQIKVGGQLVANLADRNTIESLQFWPEVGDRKVVWFGEGQTMANADQFLLDVTTYTAKDGQTSCLVRHGDEAFQLTLQLPGLYNLRNAVAAIAACWSVGVEPSAAAQSLATFRSTQRRCEFIGERNGVRLYDDYAHHPHEVASVIAAYREWFPQRRLVVGFQSHTFSRTKQFFPEFVDAFAQADEVAMIDIFPSAREAFDPSVTSDQLCAAIHDKYPQIVAQNYKTLAGLAEHCTSSLRPGDVFLTVGAGDIYQVHNLMEQR